MVIVLETSGKHESVDFAKVHLFDSEELANSYIKFVATGKVKYWTHAEIVDEGVSVDLGQPQE